MFINKTNLLIFFKTFLPTYPLVKTQRTLWSYFALFQQEDLKTICFISGFHRKTRIKQLQEISKSWKETIWITSDSFYYKKSLLNLQPTYFIRKEKKSFAICDKRFLKTEKGLYKLPIYKIDLTLFQKADFIKRKENDLLFPQRLCSFYCKGDSTERLLHKKHLKSLENRLAKRDKCDVNIREKIYLLIKDKLDKGPC